jgi:hypothetical protein
VVYVSDAFNIGGRLQVMPFESGLGAKVVARQDSCSAFDITSMFNANIDWDPYADIYGIPMCSAPR